MWLQVHESHPLSLLLDTHMRFHIANNSLAQSTLVADGGQVDTCWAGTRSESLQMVYQVTYFYLLSSCAHKIVEQSSECRSYAVHSNC